MSAFVVMGWLGNACFFSRFLVQWLQSERAGRSVSPPLFWWLSLLGSVLLGVYTIHVEVPVLLIGYAINGGIYARNILLQKRGGHPERFRGARAILVATVTGAALVVAGWLQFRLDKGLSPAWLACAFLGQATWSSRFVLQWCMSERRGESYFPVAFWWTSLVGNLLLLAYAIRLQDAVFIAGYALGPFVQIRNLMLGKGIPTPPKLASSES